MHSLCFTWMLSWMVMAPESALGEELFLRDLKLFGSDAHKIHAELRHTAAGLIDAGKSETSVRVFVRVAGQGVDRQPLKAALRADRAAPHQKALAPAVARQMKAEAEEMHGPLRQKVEAGGGRVLTSFWIVNAFSAEIPAKGLAEMAADTSVVLIEPVGFGAPDQPASAFCNPSGNPQTLPWPAASWQTGTYTHGAEDLIKQTEANTFYQGSFFNLGLPIAIADSGFDLETDQWRGNTFANRCWCPDQTGSVSPTCTAPNLQAGLRMHGVFTRDILFGGGIGFRRIARAGGGWASPLVSNTPEAVFWGAPAAVPNFIGTTGSNFARYSHGTQVASLAAGSVYSDDQGDGLAGCVVCPIFGCVGTVCPVRGMNGVAPGAAISVYKIALDSQDSLSPFDAQVEAVQQAAADGNWAFNMSYGSDADPLSTTAIAFDRAATDFDMVIIGSAGNQGELPFPDRISKGYFNGLIVAATGVRAPFVDQVSPGSSFGPLAWPDPNNPLIDIISGRDGVNISAPGGYWDSQNGIQDGGLTAPFADESYQQANYFNAVFNGVWTQTAIVGTSAAAPQVAGTAILVFNSDLVNNGARTLNQRQVRAILLNEADDISGVNPGKTATHYGQGRLRADLAARFLDLGGQTFKGRVWPGSSIRNYQVTLTKDRPTEITLVWDRVTFPAVTRDTRASNLNLQVTQGGCAGRMCSPFISLVAASSHPENNYERVSFVPRNTGTYKIQVRVPSGGFVLSDGSDGQAPGTTPKVPFALAVQQR